ncbi:phospholipase, partial [Rhodospirillum rubrum]|nr:phospholipase [Rhodospirillum rubrum]
PRTAEDQEPPPFRLPGDAVWRRAHADRCAILIDGEAYFSALRQAVIAARREVLIIAWELHSKVDLLRDVEIDDQGLAADGWPVALQPLLLAALERNPDLHIHIVLWRVAVLFLLEREVPFDLPKLWACHPRLHFVEDGDLPALASHHQKIVAIDGRLAFSGGLDLTTSRWDTSRHLAHDPRRVNPDGAFGRPWHDVQVMVDGDAARALTEIARRRWERATAEPLPAHDILPAPAEAVSDPWPAAIAPDFTDIAVSIARTEHEYAGRSEVREVEAGFIATLENARDWLFIEQQYLTSEAVGAVLERRLAEEDGPEVVIILPQGSDGPAQQAIMDKGRDDMLDRLRAADRHGRFAAYWPIARDSDEGPNGAENAEAADPTDPTDPPAEPEGRGVYVHCKVMIADGTSLRIGSANMANRSMGLDTECDVILEDDGTADFHAKLFALACRLAGDLLGLDAQTVAARIEAEGSWIKAIEALRDKPGNTLLPFTHRTPTLLADLAPDLRLCDPDRPLDPDTAAAMLIAPSIEELPPAPPPDPSGGRKRRKAWLALAAVVAVGGALGLAWTNPDLLKWADPHRLLDALGSWTSSPFAPLVAVLGIVALGLVGFPVMVMILGTGMAFDPWIALIVNLLGVGASASLLFLIGRMAGRDAIERFGGRAIPALSQRLAKQGAATVAALRNVPVMPFTLVNLVCGATHIRFRDYLVGTLLGMAPGIAALSFLGERVAASLRDPTWGSLLALAGVGITTAVLAHALQRWAEKREKTSGKPAGETGTTAEPETRSDAAARPAARPAE